MNKEKVFAWIESLEEMADQSDRYFVERTGLYKENQEKDKEIDRLNKECDTYMKIATKRGNIIEELEKLLEQMILDTKTPTVLNNSEKMAIRIAIRHIQDKLKELKEGNKQ